MSCCFYYSYFAAIHWDGGSARGSLWAALSSPEFGSPPRQLCCGTNWGCRFHRAPQYHKSYREKYGVCLWLLCIAIYFDRVNLQAALHKRQHQVPGHWTTTVEWAATMSRRWRHMQRQFSSRSHCWPSSSLMLVQRHHHHDHRLCLVKAGSTPQQWSVTGSTNKASAGAP